MKKIILSAFLATALFSCKKQFENNEEKKSVEDSVTSSKTENAKTPLKALSIQEMNNYLQKKNDTLYVTNFFATWCGPCKMLAPVFEQAGEEMKNDATFLKVDIDQSLELAQQFRISTVPTMMIFKDGKPVETLVGFMPKERIVQKVKSHL